MVLLGTPGQIALVQGISNALWDATRRWPWQHREDAYARLHDQHDANAQARFFNDDELLVAVVETSV